MCLLGAVLPQCSAAIFLLPGEFLLTFLPLYKHSAIFVWVGIFFHAVVVNAVILLILKGTNCIYAFL